MEFAQIAKWAIYGWKGAAHGNLSAEIPCFFMACRTRREQIPIVIQTARVDAAVRFCSQPNTVLASVLSVMKATLETYCHPGDAESGDTSEHLRRLAFER